MIKTYSQQVEEFRAQESKKPQEVKKGYVHPKTIAAFEEVYRAEYKAELESCDRWIKWCEEQNDQYGVNFHQGLRSAHIFNNIKMEQLLRVLKQEEPNKLTE